MNLATFRPAAAVALGVLSAALLVGCGASTRGETPAAQATPGSQRTPGAGGGRGGGGGVNGLIVALDGKTMQVRTSQGQTAVTYTGTTTFTEQQAAEASALEAGRCVVVRSTDSGSGASQAGSVTAASVAVSEPTGDSCEAGFGGGPDGRGPGSSTGGGSGGSGPSGAPPSVGPGGGQPSGMPSGGPSGAPGGGGGRGTVGKVVSVDGDQMVVSATVPGSTDTADVTVTLTSDTTYSIQAKARSTALAKGKCVAANGASSTSGAMTATSIRLSAAVDGECALGGRRGG